MGQTLPIGAWYVNPIIPLWMMFAPNSQNDPTQEKSTASIMSSQGEKPKMRIGRYVVNGTRVRITENVAGCTSIDNFAKYRHLATEGDKQAFVQMLKREDCRILDAGTIVTVEDSSVLRGAECVRLSGETDCLWTLTKSTEAPDPS